MESDTADENEESASSTSHTTAWAAKQQQLKAALSQLTLDWRTAFMAVKTSLPPTILVCAIQSDVWINHFKTNAYIIPILSTCAMPAMPLSMMLEHNARLVLGYVVAYCWCLLAGWCSVAARRHTATDLDAYNSSAEAVTAIFLMLGIWCVFTLKSAFPSWNLPCTLAGILGVSAMPVVAQLPTMQAVMDASNLVLECFLVGQAVGLVNALVFLPQTSREVFMSDVRSSLDGLAAAVRAGKDFMTANTAERSQNEQGNDKAAAAAASVIGLQAPLRRFVDGVVKSQQDVAYAANEMSWGVLGYAQLREISESLVNLMPPASGLGTMADMLQEPHGASCTNFSLHATIDGNGERLHQATGRQHSQRMTEVIVAGIEHVNVRLDTLASAWWFRYHGSTNHNEERGTISLGSGETMSIEAMADLFSKDRVRSRTDNASETARPPTSTSHTDSLHHGDPTAPTIATESPLHLHSHTLLSSIGEELVKLIETVESYHGRSSHLLLPEFLSRMLHQKRWFSRHKRNLPTVTDLESASAAPQQQMKMTYRRKDPDHLPPRNMAEVTGDYVRKCALVLRSHHSAFGFRGVCAIMTIAILAFLRDTQAFFSEQRLLWALFAILLSLGRTSGSSTFLLLCRVLGTVASMVASYIIWYIVAEKTPGVLVFLWLWFVIIGYLMAKFPQFFGIWFVALIAAIVMTANELQIRKLGQAAVVEAGQAVYAPYVIFPFRLAIVMLGVFTAYFWTIFPYPLSEHSELRKSIARAMYELGHYNVCVRKTVQLHVSDIVGAADNTNAASYLQAQRRRAFRRYLSWRNGSRALFQFLDWEFALGGRFPRQTYEEAMSILERIGRYLTLVEYLSRYLTPACSSSAQPPADGASAATQSPVYTNLCANGLSLRLLMLQSAIGNAHPLPPELRDLDFPVLEKAIHGFPNASSAPAIFIEHINWHLIHDVNRLTSLTRSLVGDLDINLASLLGGEANTESRWTELQDDNSAF